MKCQNKEVRSLIMFNLIKLSLWDDQCSDFLVEPDDFIQMKEQAIEILPVYRLSRANISSDLKKEWTLCAIQQMSYNAKNTYVQSKLPITVPYVILKGTSSAQYYPYPECRTLGDIDIMTRREDMEVACQQLLDDGYNIVKKLNREISLKKNGIVIELHRRFATLNDPYLAEYLDDLIMNNISDSHVLPDMINGLVLLEHMDQHMEGGIGLRQVIDWMMFVDKCLPDNRWNEFEIYANKIGLKKLAIVTTHMCEMFLGLPHREWSSQADEALCVQLMEYVLSSGNFGHKRTTDTNISENAFTYASTPQMALKLLQKQGRENWNAAKKHRCLRPFAWVYQLFRYAMKGLQRDNAISKIRAEYTAAKKRNAMFEALGVNTDAKGIVVYIDGKYVKK